MRSHIHVSEKSTMRVYVSFIPRFRFSNSCLRALQKLFSIFPIMIDMQIKSESYVEKLQIGSSSLN